MGLRGRSPTGVTNEGGYPKYLTAPWILSCYSSGEVARLSGFHIRATGFERRPGLARDSAPASVYVRFIFYLGILHKLWGYPVAQLVEAGRSRVRFLMVSLEF